MADFDLPSDTKLAGKVIENHYKTEQSRIDRGKIGSVFGSRASIPANIAAVIALATALVMVFAIWQWAGHVSFSYKDGIAALSSLVTLSLGYLFGRHPKD